MIEISPYCKNNPSEATPNSVGPEDYPKEIESKADLMCKEGYGPNPAGNIEATCVAKTPDEGKWRTDSTCNGKIKLLGLYLLYFNSEI